VDRNTVPSAITFYNKSQASVSVPFAVTYQRGDSSVLVTPTTNLNYLDE
jgi:hypothetical protein